MTKEVEKLVQELFLESICKNYNCGSQRCDRSDEWLEGCKLYKEFKNGVEDLISKTLKKD